MAIPWLSAMTFGIPALDTEHRRLVDILNAAQADVAEGDLNAAREGLADYLAILAEHFRREEILMRRVRYLHLDDHQRNHQTVMERAGEIREALAGDLAPEGFRAVISDLQNSLIRSMLLDDSGLATYLDYLGLRPEELAAD